MILGNIIELLILVIFLGETIYIYFQGSGAPMKYKYYSMTIVKGKGTQGILHQNSPTFQYKGENLSWWGEKMKSAVIHMNGKTQKLSHYSNDSSTQTSIQCTCISQW